MVFARSITRLARPALARQRVTPPRASLQHARTLTATARQQGKVLLVLYDVSIAQLQVWKFQLHSLQVWNETDCLIQGGEHAVQEPQLLGTTENELGIRKWIEEQGHTLVTTSDKEGKDSKFDKELVDAEVIITTPYASPRVLHHLSPALTLSKAFTQAT